MPLETGTFLNDLTITNPPGTDPILQGDDHLRLLKTVLKNTFLNADKAFAFPDAITKTGAYTVLKADINKFFQGDATAGAFSLTLPTLAAGDDGWYAYFVKSDASANAVTLVGTINGVANLALSVRYAGALVYWTGTAWIAFYSFAAPTAAPGTNTTQVATTAFVEAARVILAAADAANLLTALAADKVVPENPQTGTTYTLALTDAGKMVAMNNAGAITLTIPTNAVVAFPVNTRIDLWQEGAGQVTVGGAGVTIRSSGSKLKLTGQYSGATLWKKATDTWALIGDIAT